MLIKKVLVAGLGVAMLAGCKTEEKITAPVETMTEAEVTGPAVGSLDWALAGEWRVAPERDAARHPMETLAFFGLKPSDTVVEIWPGGGWYTSVIGPYLRAGGGKLIAASYDPEASDYAARGLAKYTAAFVEKPEIYGDIEISIASADSDGIAPEGVADVVLTFRNVHNWMKGAYADKMFADAYRALKPGGVLGVVEHRLPSAMEQDPLAASGYVQEALVRQFAEEAGFEFVGSSEVNANPADDADHPFGVWTLPPVLRTAPRGEEPSAEFDTAGYVAIGESDRMTLKFRKPAMPVPDDMPDDMKAAEQ